MSDRTDTEPSVINDPDTTDVAWALGDLAKRKDTAKRYREYYDGKQPFVFANDILEGKFGKQLENFACNVCANVVDALADRLAITGFIDEAAAEADVEGGEPAVDYGDAAMGIWKRNRMPKRQGEIFAEAFLMGDGYAIVWPDADTGLPVIYPNRADRVTVAYDPEHPGRKEFAAKVWPQRDGHWRINLYYPDRLEKYITANASTGQPMASTASSLREYRDEGDEGWPLTYDWGVVPVFHFGNNARTGELGRSELAPIIPLQDRLNASLANLAIAEEYQSFRQRWATGISVVKDKETGEPINPFKHGAGNLWLTGAKEARFGDFQEGDLTALNANAEAWEVRIARRARIPLYYLLQSGEPPSGESLKVSDGPMVKKEEDRQVAWGDEMEDMLVFALRLEALAPGSGVAMPPDDLSLESQWEPAETRNEQTFWTVQGLKHDLGVPEDQVLQEGGYTKQQTEEFKDTNDAEQDRADRVAQRFNRGISLVEGRTA